MSTETGTYPNEQVIRTMFDAYSRGDDGTLRRVLADDVVYHLPGRSPMAGDYRGRDAVLQLWDRQKDAMGGQPYRVEFLGMLSDGERTILLTSGRAEGRERTLAWRGVNEYTVRDGTVAECRVYIDDLYTFDDFWSSLLEDR